MQYRGTSYQTSSAQIFIGDDDEVEITGTGYFYGDEFEECDWSPNVKLTQDEYDRLVDKLIEAYQET